MTNKSKRNVDDEQHFRNSPKNQFADLDISEDLKKTNGKQTNMSEDVQKSPIKTANREKALTALLESSSITEAANKCGLSDKTLRRYLEEKEFFDEYATSRRQIVESAVSALQQAAIEAVETLRRNLTCDNPQAEIRAAQLILDNVFGNSENAKPQTEKQIVISFNFNNQVRLTND